MEFDVKEDEEVMGIGFGLPVEKEIKKITSQDPTNRKSIPFLLVSAILVWVPPKLIE